MIFDPHAATAETMLDGGTTVVCRCGWSVTTANPQDADDAHLDHVERSRSEGALRSPPGSRWQAAR